MPFSMSRAKQLWPWLAEARFAWMSLGVIVVALCVSLRPNTSEPTIRLTGLILQLLGIATVAWGISETRALFGQPSFAAKAKAWFGRFPLRRNRFAFAAAAMSTSVATSKMRAHVTRAPGSTVETRLLALEKSISDIHERIGATEREMDEEFRKASEALKTEQLARQAQDDAISAKLEATGTGGVHISAIGALWLFVGVILSTAGVEIAQFLK